MNFPNPFLNKSFRNILIILFILCLVYIILRLVIFPSDPFIPFLTAIYKSYLYLPEWLTNQLFKLNHSNVELKNHEFIFDHETEYQITYKNFLVNWPKFLLYKNWSALILLLIWVTISRIIKKIVYTSFFFILHLVSVVSGLYLLGIVAPKIFILKPNSIITPTLIGTIYMFSFLSLWLIKSRNEIQNTFQVFKIHMTISLRNMIEILVLLFFFLILRSFIIQFFDFPRYVHFLLEITRHISLLFGESGNIDGDQLVGQYGSLGLSKHCLGFMTMYVFASLIYLTRIQDKKKTWIYLSSGLVFLFLLNIVRLVAVFVLVQGEDGFRTANLHHEIYNMVIYVFVFAMWIVWFERFVWKWK
jgi:exosortase/archaeosortase family protein